MNIPDPIFENLVSVKITLMRIRIWDPGSCQPLVTVLPVPDTVLPDPGFLVNPDLNPDAAYTDQKTTKLQLKH
jgi:hypothetical protein